MRRLRIALAILAISTVVIVWFVSPFGSVVASDKTTIIPSESTTKLLGPKYPDGNIDYVTALNERASEGATPENNAVVLLMKVFGPEHREFSEFWLREAYGLLEMKPLERGQDRYRSLIEIMEETLPAEERSDAFSRAVDQLDLVMDHPWTREDFPEAAKWIDVNEDELQLIHKAVQRTKHYAPYISGVDRDKESESEMLHLPLPIFQSERELARLLTARAMLHLGEGRHAEAMADIEACHRLAHLVGSHSRHTIEWIIGVAIDALAFQADRALVAHGTFTAEEWLAYRDRLDRLAEFRPLIETIDEGERWVVLDVVASFERVHARGFRDQAAPDEDRLSKYKALFRGNLDWNIILKRINHHFDELKALGEAEDFMQRRERVEQYQEKLKLAQQELKEAGPLRQFARLWKSKADRSVMTADIIAGLMMPALHRVYNANDRYATKRSVLHVGLSIVAFHAKTGEYPQTLDALTPDLLKTIPQDIYSGDALRYERTDDGFRLWSQGENQQDDNGLTYGERTPEGELADDTTIEIPLRLPSDE